MAAQTADALANLKGKFRHACSILNHIFQDKADRLCSEGSSSCGNVCRGGKSKWKWYQG